ncbi:MAG: hypothetical protein COA74_02755 [Gammaproteobacteria bacterium]|nr:MAG: hypothetical protein COA74_02755 [Gammaproteobacteria bacterium]
MSKDHYSINQLRENRVGDKWIVEIYDFESANKAIMYAEEYRFDILIFDYSTSSINTLNYLEYLTLNNSISSETMKVVLTDSFVHIKESQRLKLLKYSNKVISNLSTYHLSRPNDRFKK